MIELSVVIPVKDEEDNVAELVSRLSNVILEMQLSYEIIFVTDINRDDTFNVLKSLYQNDERVKTIKLSNSFGQNVSVVAGLNYSCGEAVVIMDGDLQDYPEDIPKLYNKMREGYDIVYSVKETKNDSAIRNLFSKSFRKLLNMLSDYKIDFNTSMFRILSRRIVKEICDFKEIEPCITGLFSLIGFPTAKVMVTSGNRERGKTKYGFLRLINLSISFLLSFSSKPIRLISMFGFFVSGLSFIYLILTLIQTWLRQITVLGWPTVISLITLFGGLQLFALGIVGEYIGRIFIETKKRPLYIVEEKIGDFE